MGVGILQSTRVLDSRFESLFAVRSLSACYESSGTRGVPVVGSVAGCILPYPLGLTRAGIQSAHVHQRITGRI